MLAIALAVACSDSTGPAPPAIGAVRLSAPRTTVNVGDSVQLAATVLDEQGVTMSGQVVTWRSSNVAVASVRPSGLVSAHGPGEAFIRVASGDHADSLRITVTPAFCTVAGATATIDLGQTRSGSHSASDCLFGVQPTDGWRLTLTSPGIVEILMMSATGDVDVAVTDLQFGLLAEDFGSGPARMLLAPLAPGTYIIWVRSRPDVPLGSYQLSARLAQTPPCSVVTGNIGPGQQVNGQIEATDCLVVPDHYADSWQLSLASTSTVQIDLTSDEFDPVLLVTNAAGQWLAVDDDGGTDLNSRLVITLPAGDYLLVATTYHSETTGHYQLAVSPPASANPRRSIGTAAVARGGVTSGDRRSSGVWPTGDK